VALNAPPGSNKGMEPTRRSARLSAGVAMASDVKSW
jgi:hypothetical protein